MVVKGGLPTTGFSASKLRWTRPSSGMSCTLPFRRPRFLLLTVRVCLLMGALSAQFAEGLTIELITVLWRI